MKKVEEKVEEEKVEIVAWKVLLAWPVSHQAGEQKCTSKEATQNRIVVMDDRETKILLASLAGVHSSTIHSSASCALLDKKLLQKGTTKSVLTDVFHLNTCDHCAPVESPY